ncbi:MAG: glycosyltransferase family 2 protein [Rhodoblastus sp.]|nr:glycosyltransferase family 2 protein [Rhodoblastus sp.]
MNFDLFIPTRDSAAHIALFLAAYRDLGIEPLYIVDARSVDGTADILAAQGARAVTCVPFGDFAESGMIQRGAEAAATDWVWRLDDDEFPSRALVEWVARAEPRTPVLGVSRREIHSVGGRRAYSRWPTRLNGYDQQAINYQYRIFRRDRVRYVHEVHTAGIEVPPDAAVLSGALFTIHANCVIRGVARRLAKVRSYAGANEELSWAVADESLPEYLDRKLHRYRDDGLDEFSGLLSALGRPPVPHELPPLTERETELLAGVANLAADLAREQRILSALRMIMPGLKLAPRPLLRELSKLLCTLAAPTGLRAAQLWGDAIWNMSAAPDKTIQPAHEILR